MASGRKPPNRGWPTQRGSHWSKCPVEDPSNNPLLSDLFPNPKRTFSWDKITFPPDSDNSIQNVKRIGSFNWVPEEWDAVMIVPGEPQEFTQWEGGQLEPDEGVVRHFDENRERHPNYPLEPTFRAVELCTESDVDFNKFDIVTSRMNLRRLFIFCDLDRPGVFYINPKKTSFRIDIERMGNLVFLLRNDPLVENQIQLFQSFRTYGNDFRAKCMKAPRSDLLSGMYREILSYNLGNLKLLVSTEVDCVIPEIDECANLSAEFAQMNLKPASKPVGLDTALHYIPMGRKNQVYKKVELTSRHKMAKFRTDIVPKMYFSATDFLCLGRHHQGLCETPELLSMEKVMEMTGGFPCVALGRLVSLLNEILGFVREQSEERKYALIWDPIFYQNSVFLYQKKEAYPEDPSQPNLKLLPQSYQTKLNKSP